MDLAQRSLRSATWTTVATFLSLPVTLIQSIVLARTLPIEYFGIFAGVSSIIALSGTIFEFGLTNAFLHRAAEIEDEEKACSAYFTLRLIFETFWLASLLVFGLLAFIGLRRFVFLIIIFSTYIIKTTLAPRFLLVRRVEHRRLAIIDLTISLVSAALSMLIAVYSRSMWALLVSSFVSLSVSTIGLYLWRPFWKPKLIWDLKIFRYYLTFGFRNLVNNLLDSGLDNLDNLWTGFFLGDMLLGFYSRAFKFAIYPRQILAAPVNSVLVGTYAELKYDRRRLSMAFFRTCAVLLRAGFLMAGWLAVIAPYFIRLMIGERWLPMLPAFRLMLIFAMLDPIKTAVSYVFVSQGVPQKVTLVRFVQIIVLVLSLFGLGFRYQISGVAVAIDLMVIVGTVLSLVMVSSYVDISYWRLFSAPLLALIVSIGFSMLAPNFINIPFSDWMAVVILTGLYGAVYFAVIIILEGKSIALFARRQAGSADAFNRAKQLSPIRLWRRARVLFRRYIYPRRERYFNLNLANAPEKSIRKRALLSYIVHPFSISDDDPRFYRHINIWHAQEMVRVLNRMGYLVDVIDYRDTDFRPEEPYDLFLGHGGLNFAGIVSKLNDSVLKIYFSTISYWKFNNQKEEERFLDLYRRRGIHLNRERLCSEEEENALKAADGIIGIGNTHTRSTYSGFPNVIMIDGTTLSDLRFDWDSRDFGICRSNFLFFASQGNVHKGLDLVLDAFTGIEQNLWVAAPLDKGFLKSYNRELKHTSNIHRLGWTQPRSAKFYKLIRRCGFCILPSCSEGQAQSVIEAMNYGLVPIVSRMAGVDVDDFGFLIEPVTVEEIRRLVKETSSIQIVDYKTLSLKARRAAIERYSETKFSENFTNALRQFIKNSQAQHD